MPIRKIPGRRGGSLRGATAHGQLDAPVGEIDKLVALFQDNAQALHLTATWSDDPEATAVIDPRAVLVVEDYLVPLRDVAALQQHSGVDPQRLALFLARARGAARAQDIVEYMLIGALGSRLVVLAAANHFWKDLVARVQHDLGPESALTPAQQATLRVDAAEVLQIAAELDAQGERRRDDLQKTRAQAQQQVAGAERQQQRLRALQLVQQGRASEVDSDLLDELVALYDELIDEGLLADDERHASRN